MAHHSFNARTLDMITRIFFALGIIFFVLLFPLQALTNKKGAPASNTGAFGNDTCASDGCHDSSSLNSGPGSILISTPDTYAPGATMNFTVKVEQANQGRFGFQATVRPANDPFRFTGEFALGQGTEFADAVQRYITHDDAVSADGSTEWTFQWTAPAEDLGPIKIYAAGVAGNANGLRTGDFVYTDSLSMPIQVAIEEESLPESFTLQNAYPNPFSSQTTISYSLLHPEPVRIALYDALGRMVKSMDEGVQATGTYEVLIDAGDLPAGTYYYEIQTPTTRKTSSLTRMR